MTGSHLERTGFRHGVLAIAALGALVAALWSSSSFIGPLSSRPFIQTPRIQNAYSAILVLNAFTALVITIMVLVVDWHFDLHIPAYAEYGWVATVLSIEIIGIVLTGVSAPPEVCSAGDSLMRSSWFLSNTTGLVTLHLAWHIVFRVWHRSVLVNRPNTPVDMWRTPLPRHYPISPREKQKNEDPNFMTLEENGPAPADSEALDPYNLMFAPVATRKAQRSAKEAAKEHAAQAPSARVSAEDLENAPSRDNLSFTSTKAGELIPPGLDIVIETRKPHPKKSS
ncbi:hypothetical protein BDV93DRAFT_544390 [Ceratobasidium sp. AG-I]|nr:hypothetical protein BDV93DRAFT_544390 [Ceratobasidium sp. AG-I]